MIRDKDQRGTDIRWGIGWGMRFAAVYVLAALAIALLRGIEPFARNQVTLLGTCVMYLAAGLTGGATAGLFRRWVTTRTRATVATICVGLPISFCATVLIQGSPAYWTGRHVFFVPFMAAVFGLILGGRIWDWSQLGILPPDPVSKAKPERRRRQ